MLSQIDSVINNVKVHNLLVKYKVTIVPRNPFVK